MFLLSGKGRKHLFFIKCHRRQVVNITTAWPENGFSFVLSVPTKKKRIHLNNLGLLHYGTLKRQQRKGGHGGGLSAVHPSLMNGARQASQNILFSQNLTCLNRCLASLPSPSSYWVRNETHSLKNQDKIGCIFPCGKYKDIGSPVTVCWFCVV